MVIRIPFNVPGNIHAILAGRKTQTRRVVKLRDPSQTYSVYDDDGWPCNADEAGDWHRAKCPYGKLGSTVYGTEQFATVPDITGNPGDRKVVFSCDGTWAPYWTSSMFMPVSLSRCPLILTAEPRIERLNDIREADAVAEGFDSVSDYRTIWESLHGVGSWKVNPWVWVISFRLHKPDLQ